MKFLPIAPAFLVSVVTCTPVFADASGAVNVEILEGVPDNRTWDLAKAAVTENYAEPAFAFLAVPTKYSAKAHALDRSNPFVLRATARLALPEGKYELLLRARTAARLFLDDKVVVAIPFPKATQNGHNPFKPITAVEKGLLPLDAGQEDKRTMLTLDGNEHEFRFEVIVGSRKTRPELGHPAIAIRKVGESKFHLLSASPKVAFDTQGWQQYCRAANARHETRDAETRRNVSAKERAYWERRHELAGKVAAANGRPAISSIDQAILARLEKEGIKANNAIGDLAFIRRVSLDTIGTIPSRQTLLAFQNNKHSGRRGQLIDQLLEDLGFADHWVSFWQDLLAENPGLLKPVLNNSGPFRWWLYQALRDNLPLDRFATELIMMEGSVRQGAPAAFSLATENDAPMAAKAHVLGKAFLAVDLSCARCHDAPFHPYTQLQLFGMASMLGRTTLKIAPTSSVPQTPGGRKPFVKVSLPAGSQVKAEWHFAELASAEAPDAILRDPKDSRERLAAIITSPHNDRFARVMVNRIWQRFMGVGLIDNMDDWGEATASHPELLDFLAHELVTHDYDLKHIVRLILNSQTYQREAGPPHASPLVARGQRGEGLRKDRLFAGPARRRLSAEQLVDSLFVAVGKEFDCEELTFDPECWQTAAACANLGKPRRSWQFTSLSNERDRPALALPIAQGYIDLLTAFGWRDSRPDPLTVRDETLTPLQTMTLANGQLMHRLVRLTDDGAVTELCLHDQSLEQLVQAIYERLLSRPPTSEEAALALELLRDGFETRRTGLPPAEKKRPPLAASWSYHLRPEASRLQMEAEQSARAGDTPTPRLNADWRNRMEDLLWTLLNSPEFVFLP